MFTSLLAAALGAAALPHPDLPSSYDAAVERARRTLVAPADRVTYDRDASGTLWASAATYKASFGADGATYVPFLGSQVPRNFPVRFTLVSAEVGGTRLALEPAARSARAGDRVSIDHGPVVEEYVVESRSIEQVFVFDSLVERGALELTLDVATELEPREEDGGFVFEGPHGWVRYGATTAFDALGRSCAVDASWTGDGIRLTVPPDFVELATLPLVVDPVISTGGVPNGTSRDHVSSDVAYDRTFDFYLVVVEEVFSASDHDVRAHRVDGSSTATAPNSDFIIDTSNADWRGPRVAGRDFSNAFMVVAAVGASGGRDVMARIYDHDAVTVTAPFTCSSSPLFDNYSPDVGGDVRTGIIVDGRAFVVVWRRDLSAGNSDILARSFTSSGNPIGNTVSVDLTGNEDNRSPRISKTAGRSAPYVYNVVWQRFNSIGDSEIWGAQLDLDANVVTPKFTIFGSGYCSDAEVTSCGGASFGPTGDPAWGVVFERRLNVTTDSDVYAVVCGGGVPGPPSNLSEMEDAVPSHAQLDPAIACDNTRFVVTYSEQVFPSGSDHDVYMLTAGVVVDRLGLAERHRAMALGGLRQFDGRLASKWEAGEDSAPALAGELLATWTYGTSGQDSRIDFAHLLAEPLAACGTQYCEANNNSGGVSAWMTVYGDQSVTGTKVLSAYDLPASSATFFLTSMSTNFVPGVGGSQGNLCLGGVGFGRYQAQVGNATPGGTFTLAIDPTQIPQPSSTVAAVAGQTWYFQNWFRDSANGVATSNLTNAVALPFR